MSVKLICAVLGTLLIVGVIGGDGSIEASPGQPVSVPSKSETSFLETTGSETSTRATSLLPRPRAGGLVPSQTSINVIYKFEAPPGQLINGITWKEAAGTEGELWTSTNSGGIFRLNTQGDTIDEFSSPEMTPEGLVWDGSSFWIFTTNLGFIYQFRINQEATEILSSFESPNEDIIGTTDDLAWDGEALWYSDRFKVYRLGTSGNILTQFPFSEEISGLTWDGSNLWISHNSGEGGHAVLSKVDTGGNLLVSYPSPVFQIEGLTWDGEHLWAAGRDSSTGEIFIYQLDVTGE